MKKELTMRSLKRLLMLALCLILAQGMFSFAAESAVTVQAATAKKGVVKEGKYYYYYAKGKKVKNKWKTVETKKNGKKVSYKYYFGSNGRAYAAKDLRKSLDPFKKNIIVKKIGKYHYGFDRQGHMVKSGYYCNPLKVDGDGNHMTYYFDKKGHYNAGKSKEIRKALKYKANAKSIRRILKTPKKIKKLNSCFEDVGDDYKLVYDNFFVTIHRYPNKSEIVFGIFAL